MPPPPETNPPPPAETLAHFPTLKGDEFHPKGWDFPTSLNTAGCTWLAALRDLYNQPVTFPASLSPQAGMLLHALVRNTRPRVLIEVGMFCSISTHWMAAALLENGCTPGEDAVIHCFDNFAPIERDHWRSAEMLQGRLDFVKDRLKAAGLLDFVRIHPGDSPVEIPNTWDQLQAAGGIDFAFLDGDHTIQGTLADFAATEPVLNTGGYVILHDTFPTECGGHQGPRHVLDHIRTAQPQPKPKARKRPRTPDTKKDTPAPHNNQPVGEGTYDRTDIYLDPTNYGLGLLRRLT
ncbi:MAG: class I SAM-dependent methyltransferase [Planctomycetota bacterium]|nr:class I SAM-dependent methyltransferase [Planctomycetota bacterium]